MTAKNRRLEHFDHHDSAALTERALPPRPELHTTSQAKGICPLETLSTPLEQS